MFVFDLLATFTEMFAMKKLWFWADAKQKQAQAKHEKELSKGKTS